MIGLIGRKKGMTAIFDDQGRHTPVTVLAVGPCTVMEVKTQESHNYDALTLAFEPIRSKLVTKPRAGKFVKAGIENHRIVKEIRDFSGDYKPGVVLKVDLFKEGDKVKVSGLSKGRGFTGVIKRHGFSRPVQSHGTHESFRGGGSIGAHSYPARVWPGQKMPGHMGNAKVTVKNLEVVGIDQDNGLLYVRGAVPGAPGGLVTVSRSD